MSQDNEPIKWIIRGCVVLIGIWVIGGSWFTVGPNELANVRRFGTVLYPKTTPLQPGLHFKLPLIDTVDRLQVSLRTLHIPPFKVMTIDNQEVTISENFNYTIDASKVYHLLYEVGYVGRSEDDLAAQIIPVAMDQTARVLASQNMVSVNENRVAIETEIQSAVSGAVEKLFGITAHSLQIASIQPSAAFMESIDHATLAKNAAIAAENQLNTKKFEAEQVVATAKGAAEAAIEAARGQAESIKLRAEADKDKLTLEGEGMAANLRAQMAPFGTPAAFIDYMHAKAMLNWNGQQPQIVSGQGVAPTVIVPLPSLQAPGR